MDRNRIFLRVIGIVFGEVPPRVVARFGQRGMACDPPHHPTTRHLSTRTHHKSHGPSVCKRRRQQMGCIGSSGVFALVGGGARNSGTRTYVSGGSWKRVFGRTNVGAKTSPRICGRQQPAVHRFPHHLEWEMGMKEILWHHDEPLPVLHGYQSVACRCLIKLLMP